jgi:hypothetical protein
MTDYSLEKLRKTYKDLKKMVDQLPIMEQQFNHFAVQFSELILLVDWQHVPHYVDELFVKVSVIMDFLDTVEYGRLRSKALLVSQQKHKFNGKLGSFDKPNQFEVGLPLTACSCDGINYCLTKLKVLFVLLVIMQRFSQSHHSC